MPCCVLTICDSINTLSQYYRPVYCGCTGYRGTLCDTPTVGTSLHASMQCIAWQMWQSLVATPSCVCPCRDTPWVWYTCTPTLLLIAITSLFTNRAQRIVNRASGNRLFRSSSSEPTRALSLQSRPSGGHIDASDIVISQHPDGTQILLGAGSSGKV